jgi:AraC-like DNA-binding protein
MNLIEDNEEMQNEAGLQWSHLESRSGNFVLAVLAMDTPYPFLEKEKPALNQDLYEQLKSIYRDMQEEFAFIDSFKLRNHTWAVLFTYSGCPGEAAIWSRFYSIASRTQDSFAKAYKCSFSAAVVMDRQEIRNITKMYTKAANLLDYLPFIGKARILGQHDIKLPADAGETRMEADRLLAGISNALNEQDGDKLKSLLETLFSGLLEPSMNPRLLKFCCDELLDIIGRWREKNFLPQLRNESGEFLAQLENSYTVREIGKAFQYIYFCSMEKNSDNKYSKYSYKIQKAVQYLHKHFSEDISIADVAAAVQISDSNLSRTFKSETGTSLLEYLTNIRIETAKKLLEEDNLKIYEISEMVGYKTSQYFSQVFVKATGMNPLDYKGGKKDFDKEQH